MSEPLLERITSPRDLKSLGHDELERLAGEIRELIISTTSKTGGHLASSLGVIELTIAVHRALDCPRDRLVWDVGHQAYAHKIITGRKEAFHTIRQYKGLSGFPRRSESEYDEVDSGHAGSSISYGLGLALARDLRREDYSVVSIIGDGSMTSGVAYEAMNQAGHHLGSNLIVILNDNEMSISENVGGIAAYLSRLRIKPGYTHFKEELEDVLRTMPALGEGMVRIASNLKDTITHAMVPGMLFEAFGMKYVGPIDGYNMRLLEETIREAKQIDGPVLIHVITQKGRGYSHSEQSPDKFHGVSSFDFQTGEMAKKGASTFTEVFSEAMIETARERPRLVAITAAMKLGTGLSSFQDYYPDRFFDVGIAEQLGVNLAAGFALGGMEPVVAIYSTFLQRSIDQLSQEVCLQELPVVVAVDRAGLVGRDGSTHHGCFDITFLRMLPNMTVMAPATALELRLMLGFALDLRSPAAIRFPRGVAPNDEKESAEIELGRGEIVREGKDILILSIGDMLRLAIETADGLEETGLKAGVVNARFAKPLDAGFLKDVTAGKKLVVTLENNSVCGGFGSAVLESLNESGHGGPVLVRGLPDRFVQHGTVDQLFDEIGLTADKLVSDITSRIGH